LVSVGALSLALLAGAFVFADQPEQKQQKPAGDAAASEAAPAAAPAPAAAAPADKPHEAAKVTPEAKRVIDEVDAAYAKVQRLELAGTFSADLDAAGQQRKEQKSFTATFSAPNKFRHAMQDDILIGSTGEKAYAYLEADKRYAQAEVGKEKAGVEKMPEPIPAIIQMQNPALMLALVKSAAAELTGTFTDITKVDDSKLADEAAPYPTLRLTLPNRMVVTMLFHPETHLLRQSRTDIRPMLEERGTPEVKNATLTVDYTTVKVNEGAVVKDEQFAWAPPEGARDQAEVKDDGPGGAAAAGEASALEGKPAPAFAIKNLEGKTVSLKDLKGKVVVLDMWATWCPPCRASLPHLDKLYEETKDKGVTIYAVNLQEDKDDIQNFIKQTNLKTPVLMDSDGAVAQAYKANAIPQTIVIGKDGNVARVFVGFSGEASAKDLKAAVEKAMK
jgi:peroxiredoxin